MRNLVWHTRMTTHNSQSREHSHHNLINLVKRQLVKKKQKKQTSGFTLTKRWEASNCHITF